jgi:hypothetical protein
MVHFVKLSDLAGLLLMSYNMVTQNKELHGKNLPELNVRGQKGKIRLAFYEDSVG